MAALGCSTATSQVGRPCAARNNIRVAGFQAITQQSVNDRSQSSWVATMGSRGEGLHRANQYNSAWGRGNNTIISGRMPSFGSQSRGWWGNFLQIFRPPINAFNNFGNEDVRVDNPAREPEVLEPEVEPGREPGKQALSVVEAGPNANVAEKAGDTGSTVATSALDKVGDALRTTGLEVNLDVGLKELTIKELVLKDLGLVLEVKTKPQAQAQAETQNDEGGNNTTAAKLPRKE